MKVTRGEICRRTLTGRCPNCGYFGIFRTWFRLRKLCVNCKMELEKDESGFYLGTTSIGYVMAIILVIVPVCFLVILEVLKAWMGVVIALIGSIVLFLALYPIILCSVIMLYYTVQAEELPGNNCNKKN